jgi:hypothetical protein
MYACVFDLPYTYTPSDPANGRTCVNIELHKPANLEWKSVETGETTTPPAAFIATFMLEFAKAYNDLCGQCFVDYWGQKEPQS